MVYNNKIHCAYEEKAILKKLDHPGIVKFYGTMKDRFNLFYILEYCPNGDLKDLIERFGPLDEKVALSIFAQVVESLSYMHRHLIINGDIKLENIVFDKDWNAKLCDFNSSLTVNNINDIIKNHHGTAQYIPPETSRTGEYGFYGDVWSLGCVLYHMLKGKPAFNEKTCFLTLCKIKQYENIESLDTCNISDECKKLLSMILVKDPTSRSTLDEIKSSEIFKDLNWDTLYSRPTALKLFIEKNANLNTKNK